MITHLGYGLSCNSNCEPFCSLDCPFQLIYRSLLLSDFSRACGISQDFQSIVELTKSCFIDRQHSGLSYPYSSSSNVEMID